MAALLKAYIAKRTVNLEFLMGNHIDSITFTILDSNGVAFDFAGLGITQFTLTIYSDRTSSRTTKATHTEAAELSESGGVITWDAVFPTKMTFGNYNYELDYTDSEGNKRLAEGFKSVV